MRHAATWGLQPRTSSVTLNLRLTSSGLASGQDSLESKLEIARDSLDAAHAAGLQGVSDGLQGMTEGAYAVAEATRANLAEMTTDDVSTLPGDIGF